MSNLPKNIEKIGVVKKCSAKTFIFGPDEKADGFYYVLNGRVRIYSMDYSGKEIDVATIDDGGFFGEAIMFAEQNFPVFAETNKKTELLYFSKDKIDQGIEKEPEIAKYFLKPLANKCLVLNKRIETLFMKTVRQRLVKYLVSRCSGSESCLIELKIKKLELAKEIGTISETLSRNLKQLQQEKFIEVDGNKIKILNCQKLKLELAEE